MSVNNIHNDDDTEQVPLDIEEPVEPQVAFDEVTLAPEPLVDTNHPLVTSKELWGWYLYDCANSVYSSVAIGGFLPVLVVDLAKFSAAETESGCYVGGGKIVPSALVTILISVSVFIQTLLFIFTSSMADFGAFRKKMMIGAAMAGAFFTIMIIFTDKPSSYWLAGLLLVLSNVLFGYSVVFYISPSIVSNTSPDTYLPFLVRSHPDYVEAHPAARYKLADKLSNSISAKGFMLGYVAALFLLIVSVVIIVLVPASTHDYYDCTNIDAPILVQDAADKTTSLRIVVMISGVWWLLFTIFSAVWVHPRPGPPLPPNHNYLTASWTSLVHTLKSVKKLPNTALFLFCFFLFADAYSTIASVGVLFAKNDLAASDTTIAIMLIEVPLFAFVGNAFWLWIKNYFQFSSKTMVIITLICHTLLPVYSLAGFVNSSPVGMKQEWELYIFAGMYGFNIGAIQSFCRALYISLVPPGHEAAFFGFYELTDKGSSWIGPLIVAILNQNTGSLRYGMIWLVISFVIPLVLLRFVNVEKGTIEAKEFAFSVSTKLQQYKESVPMPETHSNSVTNLVDN